MVSFYPGPSRVHDEIPRYVKDAHKLGIMSVNHRSDDFMDMSRKTINLLKQRLSIPKNYTVFFTSSATECWEIIAQSLVTGKSYHVYNGAFGQKWFEYSKRIQAGATSLSFDVNDEFDVSTFQDLQENSVVCLTQNETSNGTQISTPLLKKLRHQTSSHLIAIDAVSSMAGIKLDFTQGDVWFASVQKCFGLPAGLAVMICSPRAIERALAIDEKDHYSSITFMQSMIQKWQTPFTPNVLGIYLLMRVLDEMEPISAVHKKTVARYKEWIDFLSERKSIRHFVANKKVHSYTVVPVQADPDTLVNIKKRAKEKGILLGEGYGNFKPLTFRIANFPALLDKEIQMLKKFLKDY